MKDKRFYIIAINPFILYFSITGLFFHQLILAQEKAWAVEWIAGSFFGFALGRAVFSFISGQFIDNFGALKVFSFYLMPLVIGLLGAFDLQPSSRRTGLFRINGNICRIKQYA